MTKPAEWICWGDCVWTYETKEEALSWKYFLYAEADGPGYVSVIEGPDGQLVSDQEWDEYYDLRSARQSNDDDQRRKDHPLLGKIQILSPDQKQWSTAEGIYGGYEGTRHHQDKDVLMADWVRRLGADRVRWAQPDRWGW